MKFDKSRVYTALNADELKPGDKVVVAQHLGNLKYQVSQKDYYVWTIKEIKEDIYSDRFVTGNGAFPLAYLIERAKNCTNCGGHCEVTAHPELDRCSNWKLKTETPELISLGNGQYAERKHYRPFRDTDELIKVWCEKGGKWQKRELTMPYIWVKRKGFPKDRGTLITSLDDDIVYVGICQRTMDELFDDYTFLDGSPCGVEE